MSDDDLLDPLNGLSGADFEAVVLKIPEVKQASLPPTSAPRGERSVALIRHCQQGHIGVERLRAAVQEVNALERRAPASVGEGDGGTVVTGRVAAVSAGAWLSAVGLYVATASGTVVAVANGVIVVAALLFLLMFIVITIAIVALAGDDDD